MHLSGISTHTNNLVNKLEGTNIKLADTRKTTPGLRIFEKYAFKCGGGVNHRMGLYDAAMIKENHIGWTDNLRNAVKKMNPGDVSEPILRSETAIFIKLLDKRKINFSDINLEKMKEQIITKKKNELLNLFSNSYLSKIKNTTLIEYNE